MKFSSRPGLLLSQAWRGPTNSTFRVQRPPPIHCHGQRISYGIRTTSISRTHVKPTAFVKSTQSRFDKARYESVDLYKAFSSSSYIFGCYVSGALMISAGIYNHSTIAWANERALEEKQRLPSFIPVFTFVGSLFLVGVGCYVMFAKSRNLCLSIRSLPPKKESSSRTLLLEIQRPQWVPFLRPGTLRIPPGDLTLIGSLKKERRFRLAENALRDAGAFAPLQLLQDAIRGIFRAVTNSGYLKLRIKGYFYAWKIDSRLAWALEEGDALERLIEVTATDTRKD